MKGEASILSKITDLTTTLGSFYPEIYRFLDEDPITIPSISHPDLNERALSAYLEDLKQLLKHHLQTHPTYLP